MRNRVEPADPVGEADFRVSRTRPQRLDVVAYRGGVAVGMGFIGPNLEDPASVHAFGKVGVLEEERRQGTGTRILRALSAHACNQGWQGLIVELRGDRHEAIEYFGKRGYEAIFEATELVLDLAMADVVVASPQGVDLVPLTDESLERPLHEASVAIEADLPAVEAIVSPSFEVWRARTFGGDLLRACSFAAVARGNVVGVGYLSARPGGGGIHGLTGVRREWRQQGIARAVKCAQIRAAKAAGLRELRTTNEVANQSIRRLNESLGYRASISWIQLRGPLLA
ncbi:GNAT family N-acetyltransferase [Pendulispora rubella]|uniref:GNAT family N-acetyltransferase n=1 Tax=Pendulispora rubella TaxID=2741070 RepID=A0ABZ2KS19_9BACT